MPLSSCSVEVCNTRSYTLKDFPLFVVLDVYGQYYFAPGFSTVFDKYDAEFAPGNTHVEVLPEFYWPQGVGSAGGIIWYSALTNPNMTELVGEMDSFTFGWSE